MKAIPNPCVASPCRLLGAALALGLVVAGISGCGTGEYERRLADRSSKKPQSELPFNELYAPQPLPDVPVSIRVPVLFKDSPLVEGAPDKNGNPADPRRVKPLLFDLPWLKFTYEGFVDDPAGAKLPFYCYVAAANQAAVGGGNPSAAWSGTLAGKGGTLDDWTDFEGQSPEGQTVVWKKLRFTGPQEFYTLDAAGQQQYRTLPGVLEIYLLQQNDLYVLIAWRMPESIASEVNPEKWARMMTGCASVNP